MKKSNKLNILVKNVKFFVKKCREKNKKLLTLNSLDETDDEGTNDAGKFLDDKIRFQKKLKGGSMEINSTNGFDEPTPNIYKKYATTNSSEIKKIDSQDNFRNKLGHLDKSRTNLKNKSSYEEKEDNNQNFDINYKLFDNERIEYNEEGLLKEQSKDRKLEYVKNEIMEYDLNLLNLYKKLEKGSKNSKSSKKNKEKTLKKNLSANATPVTKKTKVKTLHTLNSEDLNVKSDTFLRKNTFKKNKNKSSPKKNENKIEGKAEDQLLLKNSKQHSKNPLLVHSEKISKYYSMDSLNKRLNKVYSFQNSVSNRLQKKSSSSTYDIGCMYMNNDTSTKSSKDLTKRKSNDTNLFNSSKSLRQFKFLNDNKKNIEYYKKMMDSLEGTVGKPKSKNNNSGSIDNIMKIINSLLHDYVPKLIDRYEYYMDALDGKNKLLRQKIKESLDFGDIQYEEIRELKSQLVQKNHEHMKLNDTIGTLKNKLSYINEVELKNAEYLDEIVLMKNRVTYLEKIIEENDQSKESDELRKMRRNMKNAYNKMKNEVRCINKLKSKRFKWNKKKKISLHRWINLKSKIDECRTLTTYEKVSDESSVNTSRENCENKTFEKKSDDEICENETKTMEDIKIVKEYADKNVDTSDLNMINKKTGEEDNEALHKSEEKELIPKKNKVPTKNKKINTILSNHTFIQLLKNEEKIANEMQRNNFTSIPKEIYPYYHYFYSNILNDEKYKYIDNENIEFSDENYLSLCNKLKECFCENYFSEWPNEISNNNIVHETIVPYYSGAIPLNGKRESSDNNKKVCNISSAPQMVNDEWKYMIINSDVRNEDKNEKKKKKNVYNLPFDCCYKINRILSGTINCFLCESEDARDGQQNGGFYEKSSGRKKYLIPSNRSLINKKLKINRGKNLSSFSHRDTSKNKYKYYCNQVDGNGKVSKDSCAVEKSRTMDDKICRNSTCMNGAINDTKNITITDNNNREDINIIGNVNNLEDYKQNNETAHKKNDMGYKSELKEENDEMDKNNIRKKSEKINNFKQFLLNYNNYFSGSRKDEYSKGNNTYNNKLVNETYPIDKYYIDCSIINPDYCTMYNGNKINDAQNNFMHHLNYPKNVNSIFVMPNLKTTNVGCELKKIKKNKNIIFNNDNMNISCDQECKQCHDLKSLHKNQEDTKNQTHYTCAKTVRYLNPFNQYIDINITNYDEINKYLHDHFLYSK
ncbi:hypothetical protein YYG_03678 [Plasmodium vinckei petteri]|uniref:Liprin-beta-1/2 coiled-coil domain-containing protein n=1 Tax=Plasmodium vinckei petteri TaxID=138298 RepID=W7ACT8_PLAVN|nr:hypothetical protein YYG_03678 [Plasmodium vinckei petteri]CAD2100140.1 conserved Plasmodium protein, unknown function [Plasmodium vinckei petteri]